MIVNSNSGMACRATRTPKVISVNTATPSSCLIISICLPLSDYKESAVNYFNFGGNSIARNVSLCAFASCVNFVDYVLLGVHFLPFALVGITLERVAGERYGVSRIVIILLFLLPRQ
jgi:hypothetical protein